MKLFTAQREYDYEGFQILGIFSTKEAANKCCSEDVDKKGKEKGDRHCVEEFLLNEIDPEY